VSATVMATSDRAAVPPIEVQLSTLFWVGAVSAGGLETVLAVADALTTDSMSGLAIVTQVALRLTVFTLALALAGRLWNGRNWARWSLAGLLGVAGLASMLIGPVGWLLDGHTLGDLHVDAQFATFAVVRSLHIMAVVAAMVCMFLPAASSYLRRA
jgi:hypothetical protein